MNAGLDREQRNLKILVKAQLDKAFRAMATKITSNTETVSVAALTVSAATEWVKI